MQMKTFKQQLNMKISGHLGTTPQPVLNIVIKAVIANEQSNNCFFSYTAVTQNITIHLES